MIFTRKFAFSNGILKIFIVKFKVLGFACCIVFCHDFDLKRKIDFGNNAFFKSYFCSDSLNCIFFAFSARF